MNKLKSYVWNMMIGYYPNSEKGDSPVDRRRGGRIIKELINYGFNTSNYNPENDSKHFDIVIISGLRNIDSIIADQLRKINTYFILDLPDALLLSAGPHLRMISRIMRGVRVIEWKLFGIKTLNQKLTKLISLCDAITVGSSTQAKLLFRYNKNVSKIPDIIDEEYARVCKRVSLNNETRLVWEGFGENVLHFEVIRNALKELSLRYSIELHVFSNESIPKYFKHAGSVERYLSTLPCRTIFHPWRKETCADDLLKGDIGIIPIDLRNQFASAKPENKLNILRILGLPAVATPTEAYREAIQDGIDGFLAFNSREWVDKVGQLIEDINIRERFGYIGREKALKQASFSNIWPQWLKVLSSLDGRKEKPFPLSDIFNH